MALLITIGLIIILVAARLLVPPVPGLVKLSFDKLGKRNTVALCAISFAAAVVVLLIARR